MAGHEHGRALVGQRPDQVPDLAGALRVEPVGRLVEHQQVARHAAARWRWPAAAACPGSRRGSAWSAAASSPTRSRAASIRARAVRGSVVRSAASSRAQVGPAGQVGVERRPLDQRADPRQDVGRRRPASAARAARPGPRWARPARAASGSSSSCPSRWGRGSRRPRPAGRRRSRASTATWWPNRLVSPDGGDGRPRSSRWPGRRTASAASTAPTATPAVVGEHRGEQGALEQVARAPGAD